MPDTRSSLFDNHHFPIDFYSITLNRFRMISMFPWLHASICSLLSTCYCHILLVIVKYFANLPPSTSNRFNLLAGKSETESIQLSTPFTKQKVRRSSFWSITSRRLADVDANVTDDAGQRLIRATAMKQWCKRSVEHGTYYIAIWDPYSWWISMRRAGFRMQSTVLGCSGICIDKGSQRWRIERMPLPTGAARLAGGWTEKKKPATLMILKKN